MKKLATIILLTLIPGCGTLAGFHYSGKLGIKWNDIFSLTFVDTQIDIYRQDVPDELTINFQTPPQETPAGLLAWQDERPEPRLPN